jgi:ATP-dependent DNA ligase
VQKENTKNLLEAAKLLATQKWEKKQRIEKYHPSDSVPKLGDEEEWEERWGDNRWPSLSKPWKECDDVVCSPQRPWYCQAKVNGERQMNWYVDGEIVIYSRTLKEVPFRDIIREQSAIILDYIATRWPELGDVGLDGETYAPSMQHRQDSRKISGHQKTKSKDDDLLAFFIFDIMEYTLPFSKRARMLDQIATHFNGSLSNIAFLGTSVLTNPADIPIFVKICADSGFDEGIILRRGDLLYTRKKKYRSCEQIKLKKEEDAEFEVIGYKEGTGTRAGCVVWHLRDQVNKNVTFWSVMIGDVPTQRWYFKHAEEFMGRLATVKYSELSKDGVPEMPDVTHFRPEHDLP